jgi:hypothetical protein
MISADRGGNSGDQAARPVPRPVAGVYEGGQRESDPEKPKPLCSFLPRRTAEFRIDDTRNDGAIGSVPITSSR